VQRLTVSLGLLLNTGKVFETKIAVVASVAAHQSGVAVVDGGATEAAALQIDRRPISVNLLLAVDEVQPAATLIVVRYAF
jgi:hypothetical protein